MTVQELNTRLLHYADAPVTLDRGRVYEQRDLRGVGKPVGLWVTVEGEDSWKSWCEGEQFFLSSLAVAHEVTLTAEANLLVIDTPAKLMEFHDTWSVESDFDRMMAERYPSNDRYHRNQWGVPWSKLVPEYDGIMFIPYLWKARWSGPMWYSTVDCSSGCIWNLDAIESFEVLDA